MIGVVSVVFLNNPNLSFVLNWKLTSMKGCQISRLIHFQKVQMYALLQTVNVSCHRSSHANFCGEKNPHLSKYHKYQKRNIVSQTKCLFSTDKFRIMMYRWRNCIHCKIKDLIFRSDLTSQETRPFWPDHVTCELTNEVLSCILTPSGRLMIIKHFLFCSCFLWQCTPTALMTEVVIVQISPLYFLLKCAKSCLWKVEWCVTLSMHLTMLSVAKQSRMLSSRV